VDWYFKGGLIVGLIWGAARALGAYGEASRDLDITFVYGFLLTTGGWAALFFVIDRVAKFLGWKRPAPATVTGPSGDAASSPVATASASTPASAAPADDAAPRSAVPKPADARDRPRRTARRSRR
jgi:hypothetical protein